MRPSGRLRSRIVWTTALVSAIAMTAMITTVVVVLTVLNRRSVDSTLEDRFSLIASSLSGDDSPQRALETSDDAINDSTWLFAADGTLINGPRNRAKAQRVARALSDAGGRTIVDRDDRVYRAGPVRMGDGVSGVLIVSDSLDPYEDTRAAIIAGLALLGLLVTAGATGIAAWTVSRTLQPVAAMAALADDWSAQELDTRFEVQHIDDEIDHLGRTLNVLLDRVAGALRTEQQLTSELAHELRTPLTAVRGEAELALLGSPDPAVAQRLSRVVELADRMGATITTLLEIARGHERRHARTSLDAVGAAARDSHARPGTSGEVLPGAGEVRLAASTDLAVRALAPLLDNAFHYARSRVTVSCAAADGTVDVTVSDDGPGLRAGDPEQLFAAGRRDEGSHGAGLGLALARRAARELGGEVTVTSAGAPTSFTLTLPFI